MFGPELSAAGNKVAVLACVDKDPGGDFLMVHEQHRRLGIGRWVLQTILQVLHEEVSHYYLRSQCGAHLLTSACRA